MTSRSLIGTGLDQIPVNAMLGGLAYQSSENATIKNIDLRNIAEINSETTDTAKNVFVYDTSKDSDGGAWRKRTQHTSWYNEPLNTPTRGSRREFPTVAICVAENFKLTIYDGDDPDLPMWMVFNADTSAWNSNATFLSLAYSPGSGMNLTSVKCLNAKLVVSGSQHGVVTIDFITESQNNRRPDVGSYVVSHKKSGAIALRNDTSGQVPTTDTGLITDRFVNDVAITVLPLAPIDPDTGLQVPTIAVGTNNGVSVIKDDGTVISTASSSSGYHIEKVDFTDDHGLNAHIDSNSGSNKAIVYVDNFNKLNGLSYATYSNWDGVLYASRYAANVLTYRTLSQGSGFPISDVTSMSGADAAVGSNFTAGGLTLLAKNNEAPGLGMVAFVTSDYNTGYMQGDIKGAFLSDTSTDNVTGTELITNGTFDSNVNSWTTQDSTNTYSSGKMQITRSGGSGATSYQAFTTETGKTYVATAEVNSSGSRGDFYIKNGTGWGGDTLGNASGISGQTLLQSITFTATSTTSTAAFSVDDNGTSIIVDNVSVRLAEKDRSVNHNSLQVFGTITKDVVATGSELTAYGPFTNGNYLQQPYNSDLDFGNGDFNVTFWYKATDGSTQCILHRGDGDSGGWGSRPIIQIEFNSVNLAAFLAESAFTSFDTIGIPIATSANGEWNQYVLTRSNGMMNVYHNGSLYASTPSTRSLTNVAAKTWIGERPYITRAADHTSLALFRIGSTAPSAEQIKKVYDDEKLLFQENAACTLYGSSDAVTALAYDDSTSLLHVGTSSGRSDFTGLKRTNHDTSAVTTAISAQDSLIAQQ